jgi:hypothetical protein
MTLRTKGSLDSLLANPILQIGKLRTKELG